MKLRFKYTLPVLAAALSVNAARAQFNVKGNVIKAASDYKKKVITSDLVDFDSIESQYKYSILSSTTRESKSIVSNIVQKYQDKEVESNTSEYGLVEGGVNLEDIDDKLDRELKEEIEDIKRKIELKEIEVPDSSTSLETFLNTKDNSLLVSLSVLKEISVRSSLS